MGPEVRLIQEDHRPHLPEGRHFYCLLRGQLGTKGMNNGRLDFRLLESNTGAFLQLFAELVPMYYWSSRVFFQVVSNKFLEVTIMYDTHFL